MVDIIDLLSKQINIFIQLVIRLPTHMRRVRTEKIIIAVAGSVTDDCELFIRRRSQQLRLRYSTTWKILRRDAGLLPNKIQLLQDLKTNATCIAESSYLPKKVQLRSPFLVEGLW